MSTQISELQIRSIGAIAEKFNLKLVVLFGSRATAQYRKDSDFDLGVWIEKRYHEYLSDVKQLLRSLYIEFAAALHTGNIHLVILNYATPLLLWEAACKGQPLYQKEPGTWTDFRVFAAKKHWDNKPFYEAERQYLENQYGRPGRNG